MQQILVTGGAGKLGRLVVKQLSAAGYCVRGMSRRASPGEDWPGAEWKQADLVTGEGLAEAVQGMDVVVHLAGKGNWKVDFEGTRRLLEAAQEAGVSHLVFISIVGIEKVPYALSKAKLASEDLIEHSGIPWSILRATQFHYLIDLVWPGAWWRSSRLAHPVACRISEARRSSPRESWRGSGSSSVECTGLFSRSGCLAKWPAPCARGAIPALNRRPAQ